MTQLPAANLVHQVYGHDAFEEFCSRPTDEDFDAIKRIGQDVLRLMPFRAGSCGPLSAMMLARWEYESRSSLYMFAGELVGDGVRIWGKDGMAKSIQKQIESSDSFWDGHFWLGIGEYVLDLSICRTAKSHGCPQKLREIFDRSFPKSMGLLLADATGLAQIGLHFIPHAVLTKNQVDGHVLGIQQWLAG